MKLEIEQGFDSNSASPTDILLAQPIVGKLIMKMYVVYVTFKDATNEYPYEPPTKDGLDFETEVYKKLKEDLIDNPILQVRNIVPFVETVEFSFDTLRTKLINDFTKQGSSLTANQVTNNLIENTLIMIKALNKDRKKINRVGSNAAPQYEWTYTPAPTYSFDVRSVVYRGIVTANAGGKSFGDFLLQEPGLRYKDVMRYFAIILVSVRAMAKVGVNQNDLHFGNILLSEDFCGLGFQLKKYLMYYKEHLFIVYQKYTPFVYDFDRTALEGVANNRLIGYERGGNCPSFHVKRDLMKILCGIVKFAQIRHSNPGTMNAAEETAFYNAANYILNNAFGNDLREAIISGSASCWLNPKNKPTDPSLMCTSSQLDSNVIKWEDILKWTFSEAQFTVVNWANRNNPAVNPTYTAILNEVNKVRGEWGYTIDEYLSANFQWIGDGNMNSNATAFSTTGRTAILATLKNDLSR